MATAPRYATPNFEMLKTWIGRPREDDGPFWALNLMKYRAAAEYEDGRATSLSGKEADDAYSPLDSLAAVGAMVAFHGDVARQTRGEPTWDRIGIVRYPTRAAFFEMQQRDDFKEKHAHKEAGMAFTIVISCLPDPERPSIATPADSTLLLRVADKVDLAGVDGAIRVATFDVEGVILGDERTFTQVAFDAVPTTAVTDELLAGRSVFAMALSTPAIDRIHESIRTQG